MENDIEFFTGVPDSLLQNITAFLTDHAPEGRHLTAANEGNAIALAVGHYLATGKIGLVYMQNSGLGNVVNPLLSLADPEVYSVPVLLLIGWRGEPGIKDEPQHLKQGLVTLPLLETLGIKYTRLSPTDDDASNAVTLAAEQMRSGNAPYALIASKNIFGPYRDSTNQNNPYSISREKALRVVLSGLDPSGPVVSTTGKLSREIYEYRKAENQGHQGDFLNVGSMGHASQIALGIALRKPDRKVYCLDGDGAVLMHMGALAIIGNSGATNFRHIVFNNGAHDSVGGQPTQGFNIDLPAVAKACGYRQTGRAESKAEILKHLRAFQDCKGPYLLEIRVRRGSRADLGRPQESPRENKAEFMKFLK